jgi:general secretion pathway protein F
MPVYDYTALDAKGKTISGIIDADGAVAARQKIRSAGHFPVSLHEVQDGTAPKSEKRSFSLRDRFTRVRPAEIAIMTRQLATLIGAGFPLVSAMDALMAQSKAAALPTPLAASRPYFPESMSIWSGSAKHPAPWKSFSTDWPISQKSRKS